MGIALGSRIVAANCAGDNFWLQSRVRADRSGVFVLLLLVSVRGEQVQAEGDGNPHRLRFAWAGPIGRQAAALPPQPAPVSPAETCTATAGITSFSESAAKTSLAPAVLHSVVQIIVSDIPGFKDLESSADTTSTPDRSWDDRESRGAEIDGSIFRASPAATPRVPGAQR